MGITVLTVGKEMIGGYGEMADEYIKRISAFSKIQLKFIKDSGMLMDDKASAVKQESDRILKEAEKEKTVILLDKSGEAMDSEKFSKLLDKNDICFIIGGSYGVDERVKKRAFKSVSFSKMTFPHRLFRVILLEQIYRGYTIQKNMRYHK